MKPMNEAKENFDKKLGSAKQSEMEKEVYEYWSTTYEGSSEDIAYLAEKYGVSKKEIRDLIRRFIRKFLR